MPSGSHPSPLKRWAHAPDRKPLWRWGGWFFGTIGLLLCLIGLTYIRGYAWPDSPVAQFYTVAAYVSHFGLIGLVPWFAAVLPLTLLVPNRRLILGLGVVLGAATLTFLLLDSLVYGENKFHLSALTLSILGWKTWGFAIGYGLIFLVFTALLAARIRTWTERHTRGPWGWVLFGAWLLLLATSHTLHAWADARYDVSITRFTTHLPLFSPATAKFFSRRHVLVDLEGERARQLAGAYQAQDGRMAYPLAPLQYTPRNPPLDVLIVIVDAMRADALVPELTPNMSAFAARCVVFENHYSGGNSSRMGLFSLFYGLPCTYWRIAETTRCSPVLMDEFQRRGYQLGIFSSSPLYRPTSLDRTAFCRIPDLRLTTPYPGKRGYERDPIATADWLQWVGRRAADKPVFGFLYLAAPAKEAYPPDYPQVPAPPDTPQNMRQRVTRYRTAVHYADSLVGQVLRDLEQRAMLDRTAVLITADHGEEFAEGGHDYTGHGTSFSALQLRVPLLVHWPGRPSGSVAKRTSHNDIPATLMADLLGCLNPPSDYCSGNPLFSGTQWDWLLVGSYHNYAILEPGQVTVSYPGGYFEVRDAAYNVVPQRNMNRAVITAALRETTRFLK